MPMLRDPSQKYRRFKPLHLPERQWPSRTIDKPPRWLSTDLRDGNQSLVDPMNEDQKFHYFKMLVELGYKEIEVSFPSASDTDFNFTRRLIEPGVVPKDVWLQVLSPCREDLIRRTVDSVKGAQKAILHLYLATSECFRRIVFGFTQEQSVRRAVECTKYARSITKDLQTDTEWAYEFSPETFSDTSPEFVVQICEAVKAAWEPSASNPLIFNLPATVEMASPNVYADQIEYFCTHMTEREKFCVSLHPHNDRGCAVAAAELAQMAGADRVEGTLFGNGERTGNVDLVTLALNLYTQGIHPGIDFSDLNSVIEMVEKANKIPVHPRAPYGGQLVVCAFSGSHQDAIKKGFHVRDQPTDSTQWEIPYLPLDPQDIGRSYEAVIRVNSQSGKGGAAWIIQKSLGLDLPRDLQIVFSRIVQRTTNALGRELLSGEIQKLFEDTYYLGPTSQLRFLLVDYNILPDRPFSPPSMRGKSQDTRNLNRCFDGVVSVNGSEVHVSGRGNGPLSSFANAFYKGFGIDLDVKGFTEHTVGQDKSAKAAAYVECTVAGTEETVWGVGINSDTAQASLIAFLSAASSFVTSHPDALPLSYANGKSEGGIHHNAQSNHLEPERGRVNGSRSCGTGFVEL